MEAPINAQNLTSLRKFAQQIEEKIISATNGLSPFCVNPKIELAARFSHLIIRYVGLCQCKHRSARVIWLLTRASSGPSSSGHVV